MVPGQRPFDTGPGSSGGSGGGAIDSVVTLNVTIPGDGNETSFYFGISPEYPDHVLLNADRSSYSFDAPQFGISFEPSSGYYVVQFDSSPSGDVTLGVVIGNVPDSEMQSLDANPGDPPGGIA